MAALRFADARLAGKAPSVTETPEHGEEERAAGPDDLPPNEGAPGHDLESAPDEDELDGERDADRPNEGAPGHEPD